MRPTNSPPGHQLEYWTKHTKLGGSFIYVLRGVGDKPIKVGTARNVPARIATLQTGNPRKLELLYALPGGRGLEASLHQMMRGDRVSGEWFDGPTVEPTLAWVRDLGEWLKAGLENSPSHIRVLPDWRNYGESHVRMHGAFVRVTRPLAA